MSTRVSIELEVPYPLNTPFVMDQKVSGIYIIQNVFSDKCYVGATNDVAARWRTHYRELAGNWHGNKLLQADFSNDPELFVFRLLEICHVSQLRERENYHGRAHESQSAEWGYNRKIHRYPNRQPSRSETARSVPCR